MNRKTTVFLFLICFYFFSHSYAIAPPVRAWQTMIGGSDSDIGTKMIPDGQGGFWLLGTTESNNGDVSLNHGSTDVFLVHSASDGSVISAHSYGGTGIDIGNDLIRLSNGDLVVAGYTNSSSFAGGNYGGYDGFLICVDTLGNVVWTSRFGGSNADLIYQVIPVSTGYILTGGTYSSIPGNSSRGDQDMWLVQTDFSGLVQWQKNFGGSSLDIGYSSIVSGNEIITSGLTMSNNQDVSGNHGGVDAWLVKTDLLSGNIIWQKCYGGSSNDASFCLKALSSGDLLFAGYSRSNDGDLTANYGYNDAWIVQLNGTSGTIVNQRNLGGSASDAVYSIEETTNGLFIICSTTSNDQDVANNYGGEDVWVVKVDNNLSTLWSRSFGGTSSDRPASIFPISSDELSVFGYSFSNNGDVSGNHGNADLWLFQVACLSPVMNISGNLGNSCAGDTLRLVNRSSNVGVFQWYLDNARVSAAETLQLSLNAPGNYVVSLVGKTCQNSDSTAFPFILNNCAGPSADFSCDLTTVCEGGTVQFMDQSFLATGYQWQFPGGSPSVSSDPNPFVSYSSAGYYEATLTVTNSYGSSTLIRPQAIYVSPTPVPPSITAMGNDLYCNTTLQVVWYWQNQAIASDPFIFNVADGLYNAIVTDSNGCFVSTDTVEVLTNSISGSSISGLRFYPNPATDQLKIDSGEEVTISIMDPSGKLYLTNIIDKGSSILSLQSLSPGYYLLSFKGKDSIVQRPLIKQ